MEIQRRVRVKWFEHDGMTYTIGGLTFLQVREFFGDGKKATLIEVAAASLQAGEPEADWTADSVKEAFDPIGFGMLMRDIAEFNGLKFVTEGEAPAAESTSSSSAAASS